MIYSFLFAALRFHFLFVYEIVALWKRKGRNAVSSPGLFRCKYRSLGMTRPKDGAAR